ncbi:MAG: 30S ribosomal protein S6 [Anaerolineales bacterium]|jgi:small subunit ribosomal protein S6|nr:30S ribosomal protein S6 [Anaerolineales bacterium]HJO33182.1 30S ribosomal protein S6 [Anaerolineales bacterium]
MRDYEIASILSVELDESGLAALTERIASWITAAGGEVASVDNWGRRKLAYPIKKQREGHYVFWSASLPPAAPAEIERQMRLNEDVLRFMVVRAELPPPPEEEEVHEEQGEGESAEESDGAGEADTSSGSDAEESASHEPDTPETNADESTPVA